MKKFLLIAGLMIAAAACSSNGKSDKASEEQKQDTGKISATEPSTTSNDKGIGKFQDVPIDPALNKPMAAKGKAVYDMKCSACHKLTADRLVGPGWSGVIKRHRPEWIMNFATNVDEMLNKDPKAQAQLEICLVRMPNQNLTDDDARAVYEFMRENDGVK